MSNSEFILERLSMFRPSPSLVKRKGTTICIKVHESYDYVIPMERINTASLALGWIHHLSAKTWFDRVRLMQLIYVLKDVGVAVDLTL